MKRCILCLLCLLLLIISMPVSKCYAEMNYQFSNIANLSIRSVYLSANFASDHTIFFISQDKLFRSQDGGKTWKQMGIFIDNVFYSNDNFWIYDILCTEKNIIYLSGYDVERKESFLVSSIDSGDHWTLVCANSLFFNMISVNDSLFGIDAIREELRKTESDMHWNYELKHNILNRNYAFATIDGQKIFAIYDKQLWLSRNIDSNWEVVKRVNSNESKIFSFIYNKQGIFIVCNAANKAEASISINNGSTWQTIDFSSEPKIAEYKITCATGSPGGLLFLGTANKCVLVSEDFGKTWQVISKGVTDWILEIKCVEENNLVKIFAATPSGLLSLNYPLIVRKQ